MTVTTVTPSTAASRVHPGTELLCAAIGLVAAVAVGAGAAVLGAVIGGILLGGWGALGGGILLGAAGAFSGAAGTGAVAAVATGHTRAREAAYWNGVVTGGGVTFLVAAAIVASPGTATELVAAAGWAAPLALPAITAAGTNLLRREAREQSSATAA